MIRRQVVMPVNPEELWAALTDPAQVAGWFGARVEWELEEGAAARFHGDDGRDRVGRVETVRPARHLRFRWWPASGPASGPDGSPAEAAAPSPDVSEVTYVLEPVDDGTRLTVQERQVAAEPSGVARASAQAASAQAASAQAPQHLDLLGRRDTVLSGAWTTWDTRLAAVWAGLAGLAALAHPGARV